MDNAFIIPLTVPPIIYAILISSPLKGVINISSKNFDLLFKTANIDAGKKISKQCMACHDFSTSLKIKLGPPLWGIVGRDSGIIADFKYSDAMINYKKPWTREELYIFLENPKNYIKGTKMIYKGLEKSIALF